MARQRNAKGSTNNGNTRRGGEPRKDSNTKRVNFDNTRESRFEKDVQEERHSRKGYDKPMKGAKFGKGCASNDVFWYAHTPEMLRAAASLPFTDVVGDKFPSSMGSFPGIFVLHWNPNVNGDAVNQSANSHYSFTVHANSRNYQYDAPDQMLVILAGAQLFTAIAHGIRAYGIMRRFNQLDKYTPEALVSAMGFNYSDLKSNLSNMWFDLNEMISRSSQIWIPKDMPLIERWFWMSSHIYTDGESPKSQYYMFVPKTILKWNTTGSSKGSCLTPVTSATWGSSMTWANYRSIINEMFDALLNSQDRGIIFGDLLAAYGADRIYGIAGVTADYQVEPVYDPEVLTQIENSTCLNLLIDGVYQDATGRIYTQFGSVPANEAAKYPAWYQSIINFHQKSAPTPEQIMVATRLTALGVTVQNTAVAPSTDVELAPATCGTEYVTDYAIFLNSYTAGPNTKPLLKQMNLVPYITGTTTISFELATAWTAFDWAPQISYYDNLTLVESIDLTTKGSVGSYNPAGSMMDIDMFTFINRLTLQKMHTTAVYSEFGVPTLL